MANWNGWSVAAGLAGALAVFGPAWAQTPNTPNNMGTSQQGTTDSSTSKENGTRSGWSGSSATEPGEHTKADDRTAGSQGSSSTAMPGSSETAASASAKSGKVDKKLQDDLQKLHADNQAEVHMGQMGEQQATSPELKQFAQKLQQDHQKLDDKVTQTAQSAGISLEGKAAESAQKDADKEMKKLHGKTGQDFDKAFLSQMVKDHEKDIKAMEMPRSRRGRTSRRSSPRCSSRPRPA
jgi:putative membrane protein